MFNTAYYSTHGISQFLLNNKKQRVRFLLAHPVYLKFFVTFFTLCFGELNLVELALDLVD